MVRRSDQTDGNGRRGRAAPRLPELVATVVWLALAVWTVQQLAADSDGFAAGLLPLIATGALGLLLGVLWLARALAALLILVRTRRVTPPSLRWLPLPAAIVIVYLIPAQRWADDHFLAHRAEFDGLAATVRAGGVEAVAFPVQVGAVTVRSAWVRDGCVFLCIERSPDGERGFAHSPASPPPRIGEWVVTQRTRHLDGPWYRYALWDE